MAHSLLTQLQHLRAREKVQLAPATFYTTTPCLHATKERRAEKGKEKEKVEASAAGKARGSSESENI